MLNDADLFAQWEAGQITDTEAFRALVGDLEEIEGVYKRATEARQRNRERLERIVTHAGGRISAGGHEAIVTAPAKVVSYDAKAVDSIMAEALAAGDIHTANRLAQARRESERSGYIKIGRVK